MLSGGQKGPCTLLYFGMIQKKQSKFGLVWRLCVVEWKARDNYSRDCNKGSQYTEKGTLSCRLDELIFPKLCVSQP